MLVFIRIQNYYKKMRFTIKSLFSNIETPKKSGTGDANVSTWKKNFHALPPGVFSV